MSTHNENRLDDLCFDRLVDGELSETEYRATLGALDSQPDGWRRCALAFLEAQAWGREFRQVRAEAAAGLVTDVSPRRAWSWMYAGVMAVACAASFLLAFGIFNQLQRSRSRPSNDNLVNRQTPTMPGRNPTMDPGLQFAGNTNAPDVDQSPLGRYRLVVNGESGSPQEVEMPVFAADDPRANLLLDEEATTPHELIRFLRNSGNEVRRQRNWIPLPNGSGSPLYVPMDELQVTPVSNRSFQ